MDTKPRELSAAAVLESMSDGFVALDLDWRFTYANARGAEFQGCSAESLIGRNLFEVYPRNRSALDGLSLDRWSVRTFVPAGRHPFSIPSATFLGAFALYFRAPARPTGRHNHLIEMATHTASIAIVKAKGEQAQIRAQIALRNREAMFQSVFENAGIGMTMVSSDQQLTKTNPAFARMLGYTEEELSRAQDRRGVLIRTMSPKNLQPVPLACRGRDQTFPGRQALPDARTAALRGAVSRSHRCRQEGTTPPFTIGMIEDITARKRFESRIEYLATHDGLTDLPNRNLIRDRIAQAIGHARRAGIHLALMFVDLDRFKVVNDGFGHPFGDRLLKAAGERFQAALREDDTVARLGGDEFLILLTDLHHTDDVYIVAQKILDALERPFALEGREVHLSASIGVSLYPQDGEDFDTLLGHADVAMYRAKDLGRGTYQFFTQAMSAGLKQRVEREVQLRHALERGELRLAFQPKVDLASGAISGAEVLLHWKHPEAGIVAPANFIPLAEETGLIVPIGEWVLRSACAQARAWTDAGLPPVAMAVNLSARQFLHHDIVALVESVLKQTGLPPGQLELELTETLIARDVEKVAATIERLHSAGVRFSIDDFGTGYSNLAQLKRFRVDRLKIDQTFVRNLPGSRNDAAIALAIISLARALDLKVIAEGVETAEQCAFLRKHGCDEIQGFYFSRPVPAAALRRPAPASTTSRSPATTSRRRRSVTSIPTAATATTRRRTSPRTSCRWCGGSTSRRSASSATRRLQDHGGERAPTR